MGPPQVLFIHGAQLHVHKERPGTLYAYQFQAKVLVIRHCLAGIGRSVGVIWHAVTIIVIVKDIGDLVAIGIRATTQAQGICDRDGGGVDVNTGDTFHPVSQRIAVRVGIARVEIPGAPAEVKAEDFGPVADAVVVTVHIVEPGAQFIDLDRVGQAVAVIVAAGSHSVGGCGAESGERGEWRVRGIIC